MAIWARISEGFRTPPAANPGDPNGIEFDRTETFSRAAPFPMPSAWNGYPAEWNTQWGNSTIGMRKLIDTAWMCLDLNTRVLASFPVYCVRGEKIMTPKPWMIDPDPMMYTCWNEFAKQLFWDYLMGEAFVLSLGEGPRDGKPVQMRVIPPWCVNVEIVGGARRYKIGSYDCTDEMLHIRYTSTTDDPRGHGPLEAAGARILTAGLLQKYAGTLAETGGVPHYWIGVKNWLNPTEAEELLDGWVASRKRHQGEPGVIGGDGVLHQTQAMSAKDLALLELAQFSESRIAVLLGAPPFLVGLPGGGDSMTYQNVQAVFDFHDRSMLKPTASFVMSALSNWALVRGQSAELNRDDYSRPDFKDRATAWEIYIRSGVVSSDFVRKAERFDDEGGDVSAAGQLTGMTDQATQDGQPPNDGGYGNVRRIG
jgi:HK97 family phage portal protein